MMIFSFHNREKNGQVGNALMEEVTDADLLDLDLPGTRQRRDSGGSTHSNERLVLQFLSLRPTTWSIP